MIDAHLTAETLAAILDVDRTEEENQFLLHHLAICPECHAVGGYILDLYRAGAIDLAFSVVDLGLGKSRAEAPALWQELSGKPLEAQQRMVRRHARFRSWGLCELLCDESLTEAPRSATTAIERAVLAVEISGKLEPWQPAEPGWIALIRGYCGIHLANALRVQGEMRRTEEALLGADRQWVAGMADFGDVLDYEARYLALKASIRRDQRKLPEALDLLDQAIAAAAGTPTLVPKLLLNQAKVLEELDLLEEAISVLLELEANLGNQEDERLSLCVEHNLLWLLTKSGRFLDAKLRFTAVEERSRKLGNDLDLVRLRWIEGTIAAGLGDAALAATLLLDTRAEFEARKMGYDVALVALELAVVYVREGRRSEVITLAEELIAMFRALGIDREALAAVALFHEAALGNRLTVELAEQVLDRVRRGTVERTGPANDRWWKFQETR
jgi:tetratricopeptide (TPR) repeat protein